MISNKQLGIILIIIGIVATLLTTMAKQKEDFYIEELIKQHEGVCVLENDYCLHQDRKMGGYIAGWVLGGSTILLGIYLLLFERTYQAFLQERNSFTKELAQAKHKDEFSAYLAGFSKEEQTVLKIVHEEAGITQSTLRYKTDMSKTSLSLLLKQLEERNIISKKPKGKTHEIYLKQKF